ncbi:hypothetical protein BDW42DRAFT_167481 [Aspergillus taichungensis]|uniref:Uncharacterized protein n=1 Tax=Aspergillus taichungensis TaxID=482145 RepID=A0A2J5HX77_9EURO|nr:hypothetical protein BDW42DRAFT_167481 [Aspergillus taichungensis]
MVRGVFEKRTSNRISVRVKPTSLSLQLHLLIHLLSLVSTRLSDRSFSSFLSSFVFLPLPLLFSFSDPLLSSPHPSSKQPNNPSSFTITTESKPLR